MLWRTIAIVSLIANLVLAGVLLLSLSSKPSPVVEAPAAADTNLAAVKTNVVIKRQFFSWGELESSDYPTYIANLRDIGCPEQTIRDIIIADVNSLFARRRATELVTPEQQWWRSLPDSNVVAVATEKSRALEEERRGLLTSLLGPSWEGGDLASLPRPSRAAAQLDGPVLGLLPVEIHQAVQNIWARSQDRLQGYLDAQQRSQRPVDTAELARLRKQMREDLATVLTPPQLEEFMLRYSSTAENLRNQFAEMRFFSPSPEEFRNIYRATESLDEQIDLLSSATDPNMVAQRTALEQQREAVLRNLLGARRYAEYVQLQDPIYRDAMVLAQQSGNPAAAQTIYELNLAGLSERESIQGDPTLTPEQKVLELKRIELEQMRANSLAAGHELPPEPASSTPTARTQTQPPRRTYVVRPGDTFSLIAMIHNVPMPLLRSANPEVDPTRLRPGTTLNIPPALMPPVPMPR